MASFDDLAARRVAGRTVAFDLRHRPGALTRVCGLPILVRNLLLLERAGFRRMLLVVDSTGRTEAARVLAAHPRVTAAIGWVEDDESGLGAVVSATAEGGQDVVYWPADVSCGVTLPDIATTEVAPDGAVVTQVPGGAPLAVIGGCALRAHHGLSVDAALDQVARDGRLVTVPPVPQLCRVATPEAARRATASLLRSLRKRVDGGFSSRFNRPLSLAITARIAHLPVAPNQATAVAGACGLASGLLAAQGGYAWLLAGALAYLASNVIDGVDGEIARAKLLESRAGQWLDTVTDDLTNLAFCTGSAVGCASTWHSDVYLVLGGVTVFSLFACSGIMYHYLITVAGSGDLNAFKWPWQAHAPISAPAGGPSRTGLVDRIGLLLKRDAFAYWALLSALAGQARVAVWLAAIGSTVVWLAWAGGTLAVRLRRRGWDRRGPRVAA